MAARQKGTGAGDVLASQATHLERMARLSGRACDKRAAELLRELATRVQLEAERERQRKLKNRAKSRDAGRDIDLVSDPPPPDVPGGAGGTSRYANPWQAERRTPRSVTLVERGKR